MRCSLLLHAAIPARRLLNGRPDRARFASQRPEKVAGVVVLGASPGIDDPRQLEERLARDDALAARLRAMRPQQFDAWLRDEWYCALAVGQPRVARCL